MINGDVQVCLRGAALIPHCVLSITIILSFPSNCFSCAFLDSFQASLTCVKIPGLTHKYGKVHVPKADSIDTFVDENLRRKKVRTPQG